MLKVQGRSMALVCATALTAVSSSWTTGVRASEEVRAVEVGEEMGTPEVSIGRSAAERWNRFSADVLIRRGLRDAADAPIGEAGPAIRYRWSRTRSGGRWKTSMAIVSPTRPAMVSPSNAAAPIAPVIARIEDEGDGSGPRYFDQAGEIVRPPGVEDQERLGAAARLLPRPEAMLQGVSALALPGVSQGDAVAWMDAVVPAADRKRVRRVALQQRLGKAVGKIRGLDRYVVSSGTETTEVLVDSEWNVPVAVNVMREGSLQEHRTFLYEAGPGGSLVRRGSHAQRLLPDGGGMRIALDVELTNVTLTTVALEGGR